MVKPLWTDLTRFYPHPKLVVLSLVRAIRLSQFAFSSQESALHVAQRHLQRLGRNLRLSWRYNQHIGGFVILEFPNCTTNERFPRNSNHWVPNHQHYQFGGFTKLQRIQPTQISVSCNWSKRFWVSLTEHAGRHHRAAPNTASLVRLQPW